MRGGANNNNNTNKIIAILRIVQETTTIIILGCLRRGRLTKGCRCAGSTALARLHYFEISYFENTLLKEASLRRQQKKPIDA